MSSKNSSKKSIVLFDGACDFCNSSVNFIVRHNRKDSFVYIPFQSTAAKEWLNKFNLAENYSESIVLIEDGKTYFKSTAVLRMFRKLNSAYNYFFAFILVPKFIRDRVYDWIAKHRNHLFGKHTSCAIPEE